MGYELQSSLLVADRDGAPICSPAQNLSTADGLLSTRTTEVQPLMPHLDELSQRMSWLEQQAFDRPLRHRVDREGDSVAHRRAWSAQGWHWLVRVKAGSRVRQADRSWSLREVAFKETRPVAYQGTPAVQWLAETRVALTRPAKPKRREGTGKRVPVQAAAPLPARLMRAESETCSAGRPVSAVGHVRHPGALHA
ncbi:hypothetical protein GCM10027514_41570 [Azotobacter armeniacus]